MADQVTLRLSNPLSARHTTALGLEDRDYKVREDVTVTRSVAQSIIEAGYAQVDPEDRQAVARALSSGDAGQQERDQQQTTAESPSATSAATETTGDDSGSQPRRAPSTRGS